MKTHAWGESRTLLITPEVELVEARGRAGGASSTHLHRQKANIFIVHTGKMFLWIEDNCLVMGRGDSWTVAAGRRHRMEFFADTVLYELYVANPGAAIDPGDIVRFDEGRPAPGPPGKETTPCAR